MKDTLKRTKLNIILYALITIALGIAVIRFPAEVTVYVCKIVGIFLILMGGVGLVAGFISDEHGFIHLAGNGIMLVLGIWIFAFPSSVVSLIPMFFGVILILHGFGDFAMSAESRSHGYEGWLYLILCGLLCVILGVFCILDAFEVMTFGMTLMGISLIFDGLSDIFIVFAVKRAVKKARDAMTDIVKTCEAVDVDYEEKDAE